jgi:hypothetical protein
MTSLFTADNMAGLEDSRSAGLVVVWECQDGESFEDARPDDRGA